MNKTQIKAEIVSDSLSPQGERLTSLQITLPHIILAEINTHRMLSKNTSSSRAIPFKKMIEAVQNDPFVPIAWQKHHSGMQGTEYFQPPYHEDCQILWLEARDKAVESAQELHEYGVTKQLCNRLLEPFMWTTMLITGSKEGWDNFFELRCPQYTMGTSDGFYKSRKDLLKAYPAGKSILSNDLYWLSLNKGQAEIHIMDLAEKIHDVMNESTPKQLQSGEWHIPFIDKINLIEVDLPGKQGTAFRWDMQKNTQIPLNVLVSTAMAARTSYTVVGNEKEVDYEKMIKLHDRLIEMRHDSPLEHCARAMSDEEYYLFSKGQDGQADHQHGWCRNFKGFIQYRHLIENEKTI